MIPKRTALPQTEGLFIGAFERLHPEYPDIELELVRIDTFSSSFPRDPNCYRPVATTNLFGDILSDQASGLALLSSELINIADNHGSTSKPHLQGSEECLEW